MDLAWVITWIVVLLLALGAGWIATVLGLPGTWLMVAAIGVYAWLGPATGRPALGWWPFGIALGLATVGEILETAAGALGVAKAGGSKRGAALALLGSIIGGIAGLCTGSLIPVPVIGPLITAIALAAIGAMIGAVLGEQWKGRDMNQSLQIGHAAFWGRVVGTLSKVVVASIIVVTTVLGLVIA